MTTVVIIIVIAVGAVALGVTPSGFSWGRSGPRVYFRFGRRGRK